MVTFSRVRPMLVPGNTWRNVPRCSTAPVFLFSAFLLSSVFRAFLPSWRSLLAV